MKIQVHFTEPHEARYSVSFPKGVVVTPNVVREVMLAFHNIHSLPFDPEEQESELIQQMIDYAVKKAHEKN